MIGFPRISSQRVANCWWTVTTGAAHPHRAAPFAVPQVNDWRYPSNFSCFSQGHHRVLYTWSKMSWYIHGRYQPVSAVMLIILNNAIPHSESLSWLIDLIVTNHNGSFRNGIVFTFSDPHIINQDSKWLSLSISWFRKGIHHEPEIRSIMVDPWSSYQLLTYWSC